MSDIDFDSYVESQLDRADFYRKAKREDEDIENAYNSWKSKSDIEKLEYIDFMTTEHMQYNCACTQDDKGNVRWVNLICYRCKFVNEIRETKPELLEGYRWVRPESHFSDGTK